MIILFEENEKKFTTLGLGVLKDAIKCVITEKLNDEYTLELEYPITGNHFSKIKHNRILYCRTNPYDTMQAFRIITITKPINGIISVFATHISYDLSNIPVNAFSGTSLSDVVLQIQNKALIDNDFKIISDISSSKTFKTNAPFNLRAILMGNEESIISEYNAELKFDNFIVNVLNKRGMNRGAMVKYGYNMTDLSHEISTDLLYNGVFPYYHTESSSTETNSEDEFTQVYIVGSKPFQDGWLSFSKDGTPYHPIDETPVQIATPGDYYQKVYVWNTLYLVYQEKIYNETITVIQGVLEPTWLYIDWAQLPNISCKAAVKGYFKTATDDDWGNIKGPGDIIFEGSIISSGTLENLILYFSEVVPTSRTSENEEVNEIVDVQLDEGIMWLDTSDAKSMKYNRILMLDLSSEFEEEPTKDRLKAKAEELILKNKIGSIKHTTTVSFIDMSSTNESAVYENFDHIELGDAVRIVYEEANISIELRAISLTFDVIANRYDSVELGEKKDKMSDSAVQSGDGVSSLTNDVGYASVTTVNKLIADMVTANYIEALSAKLSKAQISQLEVERINVKGIIEASQFTLDALISKLLVAEDAQIANTLTAGKIKVSGDISITSGSIFISSNEGTIFLVDNKGNVKANSVEITGGTLNINDGVFEVTNDGVLSAKHAEIEGTIRATTGEIAGLIISNNKIYYGEIGSQGSIYLSPSMRDVSASIAGSDLINNWVITAGSNFGVTDEGKVYMSDAVMEGEIRATNGQIANFQIKENSINTENYEWTEGNQPEEEGIYIGEQGIQIGKRFKVNKAGGVTSSNIEINGGSMSFGSGVFQVTNEGSVTALDINVLGGKLGFLTILNPDEGSMIYYSAPGQSSHNLYFSSTGFGDFIGTYNKNVRESWERDKPGFFSNYIRSNSLEFQGFFESTTSYFERGINKYYDHFYGHINHEGINIYKFRWPSTLGQSSRRFSGHVKITWETLYNEYL